MPGSAEHVITNDRYIYYADYYALAAEAGLQRSRSTFKAAEPIRSVNPRTFDIFEEVDLSIGNLRNALEQAYDAMFIEAQAMEPMRDAFNALSSHIKKWTGKDINNFLSSNGIKVKSSYAQISNLLDQDIGSSNIS